MKIYDISRELTSAPVYPGADSVVVRKLRSMEDGASNNVSLLTLESHMGSHADAFSHFIQDGLPIDMVPLEHYVGDCILLSMPAGRPVERADLEGRLNGFRRVALRTDGSSQYWLTPGAAEYLVEQRVICLLIDGLSVGELRNEAVSHRILLGNQIAVVENLTFEGVPDGVYFLVAAPIKISNCDGAPVRALLIDGLSE